MEKASASLQLHTPHFEDGTQRHARAPSDTHRTSEALSIGLVNNMPDSAFAATERQFSRLLETASGGNLKLRLYTLPTVPRGPEARALIATGYRPVADLYRHPVDALIVTGTEPKTPRLDDEPYWGDLATLIDWARDKTVSSLWSCLAAHAAVFHLDHIERRRLRAKRSGAFVATTRSHGLPPRLRICHSRLNEVRRDDLVASGYSIVSESPGGHVDIFAKSTPSAFVFYQGHPEYDADSLMREYRRDVGRYIQGERSDYPDMPENYFDAETVRRMASFRDNAMADRDPARFAAFPKAALRRGLPAQLAASAANVFTRWLETAAALKVSA
jgi:homoserine O-succinyltransferase